jgi:hypothetical protein
MHVRCRRLQPDRRHELDQVQPSGRSAEPLLGKNPSILTLAITGQALVPTLWTSPEVAVNGSLISMWRLG